MDDERLSEMAGDPRFIAGIYNYCDRWCERCGFTGRCMNYAIGQEEFADKDEDEQWQALGRLMRQTTEAVRRDAEKEGIDLEAAMKESAEAEEAVKQNADERPCCRDAKGYMEAARAWFEAAGEVFEMEKEGISEALRLELPDAAAEETVRTLNEATETVRWYEHQIYIKLIRASRGMVRSEDGADYLLDDVNGSAKVALIGMDRSIHAWDTLYRTLGDGQDGILDILVQLQRLRKSAEAEFPGARAFVRPGLDEMPEEV